MAVLICYKEASILSLFCLGMKFNSSDNSTENVMKTEHDNSAANTSTESIDPRGTVHIIIIRDS